MPNVPKDLTTILDSFAGVFTKPSWQKANLLFVGAIMCQGARRVSRILCVMGLSQEKRFEKYHRFFNRARWSSLSLARILLGLLVSILPKDAPLLIVVDDTLERRKGRAIKAKGCYRDACRSSEKKVVTCFGLKWVCLMLIVPLPWAPRPWALPVMTLLAPSKQANAARGRTHRTSIDWTILSLRIITRWLARTWVLIGDGGFACIRLGHACLRHQVTLVSRLRLDVALYDFPAMPKKNQRGRRREKGQRVCSLKTLAHDPSQPWRVTQVNWYGGRKKDIQLLTGTALWYTSGEKPLPIRWVITIDPSTERREAFFSTQLDLAPEKIIEWFVLRWNIEVTFEEVRAQLGFETQRQWSDKAIARTTPLLMGLFSMVCLFGIEMMKTRSLPILSTAWYNKESAATFSDILAFVKRAIWSTWYFNDSTFTQDSHKIQPKMLESLVNQLLGVT